MHFHSSRKTLRTSAPPAVSPFGKLKHCPHSFLTARDAGQRREIPNKTFPIQKTSQCPFVSRTTASLPLSLSPSLHLSLSPSLPLSISPSLHLSILHYFKPRRTPGSAEGSPIDLFPIIKISITSPTHSLRSYRFSPILLCTNQTKSASVELVWLVQETNLKNAFKNSCPTPGDLSMRSLCSLSRDDRDTFKERSGAHHS